MIFIFLLKLHKEPMIDQFYLPMHIIHAKPSNSNLISLKKRDQSALLESDSLTREWNSINNVMDKEDSIVKILYSPADTFRNQQDQLCRYIYWAICYFSQLKRKPHWLCALVSSIQWKSMSPNTLTQ